MRVIRVDKGGDKRDGCKRILGHGEIATQLLLH